MRRSEKCYTIPVGGYVDDFAFETLKLHKLHAGVVDTNFGSARALVLKEIY